MKNCFVISQGSLPQGSSSKRWEADGKFFAEYGSPSIKGADITLDALIVKTDSNVRIDLDIRGNVTVACDRCLEDMTIPVECKAVVGTDQGKCDKEEMEAAQVEDGEIILDQVVYDYVMLSIPLVHSHPEGQCNAEVIDRLNTRYESGSVSPFAGLSNMLKKK